MSLSEMGWCGNPDHPPTMHRRRPQCQAFTTEQVVTPNEHGGQRTDHSDVIAQLRKRADAHRRVGNYAEFVYDTVAADLLETHDATGISLDHWTGPLNLVCLRMSRLGLNPQVRPNGA